MAEDPSEIRQAIEQTRAEMADTVQALGEKADVKGRAQDKLHDSADQVREKLNDGADQVRAKASEVGHKVDGAVPDQARPAVDQVKSVTSSATTKARAKPAPIVALAAAVLVVLVVRRRRRRSADR